MSTATTAHCMIRWLIRRDMPQVLDIESRSYSHGWQEADFLHCLRQRNCIGLVAEQGHDIRGFIIYELQRDSLKILNMAVDPKCRHQDVGTQIVEKLKYKNTCTQRTRLIMDVRESNLQAQLFLRAMGFKAIGVEDEHFADTNEAAFHMVYRAPHIVK